ncbi:MAG: hypothetical protein AAB019_11165 [Planctomycetota bacterium]
MQYDVFRSSVKALPLISREFLRLITAGQKGFGVQLNRWQDAGKVIKLRKGFYILNENDRKINPSRLFIAKELYSPSYVSMEYALSYYGLIPERVTDITCITSKKTAVFRNALGKFIYQHLDQACFTGFLESEDEAGLKYFIATPEKATVDFLYLNQRLFQTGSERSRTIRSIHGKKDNYQSVLTESLRFQNTGGLNRQMLSKYAGLFHSQKLKRIIDALIGVKNV